MNWKRISYSALLALAITTVAYVFYDRGGEFVLWPGIVTELMLNGVLLAIPSGDDFYSLPAIAHLVFNVVFYTLILFTASFLRRWIREK